MNAPMRRTVLMGFLLAMLAGCTDFEMERREFCVRNPDICDAPVSDAGNGGNGTDAGDGGDGADAGTPDAGPFLPPLFIEQPPPSSYVEAGGLLTFRVTAQDPQGGALWFSWAASVGTLGSAQETGTASQLPWTAPACLGPGVTASFTVTATNDQDLSVTARFSAVGIPDCPTWSPTGSLATGRNGHTATLLPSGKVLVTGGDGAGNGRLATTEFYTP